MIEHPCWKIGEKGIEIKKALDNNLTTIDYLVDDIFSILYFLVNAGVYVNFNLNDLRYIPKTGRNVIVGYKSYEVCCLAGISYYFTNRSTHPQYISGAFNPIDLMYYTLVQVIIDLYGLEPYFPSLEIIRDEVQEKYLRIFCKINRPFEQGLNQSLNLYLTEKPLFDFKFSSSQLSHKDCTVASTKPELVVKRKKIWTAASILPPSDEQRDYASLLLNNRDKLSNLSNDDKIKVYFSVSESRLQYFLDLGEINFPENINRCQK